MRTGLKGSLASENGTLDTKKDEQEKSMVDAIHFELKLWRKTVIMLGGCEVRPILAVWLKDGLAVSEKEFVQPRQPPAQPFQRYLYSPLMASGIRRFSGQIGALHHTVHGLSEFLSNDATS